ncbi:hypothetical protein HF289_05255 [Acidithiobacillus ferrooxidans]|uniref:hypothetical protein n=1 Tax=Acidithiobacillus ferrooxidans TaxID=920 RepID=UPI001C06EF11|nr:hypothetical protein [Acidithiobacillus ferrooxidans]MBU2856300.1 hypothetical protein [Acidithiobacillus ferrooxidans]MBU2862208.1 hypothetical protein [Acidithiobacillus ferrooxidans]
MLDLFLRAMHGRQVKPGLSSVFRASAYGGQQQWTAVMASRRGSGKASRVYQLHQLSISPTARAESRQHARSRVLYPPQSQTHFQPGAPLHRVGDGCTATHGSPGRFTASAASRR